MNICRGCIAVATAILCASECVSLAMTKAVRRPSRRSAAALKLHLYDHCPYCTRVELVLGWHGRSYERAVYGYADVQGPMALTGKKVLPVITWRDEENMEHTMGESLDIIEAVEAAADQRLVGRRTGRKDLKAWQSRLRRVMHGLTRPRLLQMPIADFATEEDRRYQMRKYMAKGFDYKQSLASTNDLVPRVDSLLRDFPGLIRGEKTLNPGGWSWDDLYVLPSLRVLTCVKPITWPASVRAYVEDSHGAAGVKCYFDHAC